MKPHSKGRRAASLVGALSLLASACSQDGATSWPIPLPPPQAALEARMRARIDDAVADLRRELDAAARWLELGMTYEANELFALAVECYGRALELEPSAKGWHRLACAEASRGDPAAAAQAMRRSLALEPGYAPSAWRLGTYLFDLGEFEGALEAFREVTRLDPEHLGGPIGIARVHLQRGEAAQALAILEPVQRARPEDRTLSRLLHGAYLQAGRSEEAARIDVSPRGRAPNYGKDPWQREFRERWERPRMERALEALQAGQTAQALEILEAFTAEAPEDLNASAYLAQAYLQAQRPADAVRVAREALARAPENLLVLRVLARIQESQGQLDEALATFTRMLAIDADDASAWLAKGRLETRAGRRAEALVSLQRAYALDRRDPEMLVEIGALQLGLERPDEAIRSFELAQAAGVQRSELVLGLARAYAKAGRRQQALELVTRASGLGRAGEVLLQELRALPPESEAPR